MKLITLLVLILVGVAIATFYLNFTKTLRLEEELRDKEEKLSKLKENLMEYENKKKVGKVLKAQVKKLKR